MFPAADHLVVTTAVRGRASRGTEPPAVQSTDDGQLAQIDRPVAGTMDECIRLHVLQARKLLYGL